MFSKDKRKVRRNEDLINYTIIHIKEQKHKEKFYKKKPNQILIHDKDGNYKIVCKIYAMYHMSNDEYETETELEDKESEIEAKSIMKKYNK